MLKLRFYVNNNQIDSIINYVPIDGNRILIAFGLLVVLGIIMIIMGIISYSSESNSSLDLDRWIGPSDWNIPVPIHCMC